MSIIKVNRLENLDTTSGGIDINSSGQVVVGTLKFSDNTTLTTAPSGGISDNSTNANSFGLGPNALDSETSGSNNTALGSDAGTAITTATYNTAIGRQALKACTTGGQNTALGYYSGASLTTGAENTLLGVGAGQSITTGGSNTLVGRNPAINLTTGSGNTVVGQDAAEDMTTASSNTIIGRMAAQKLTTGGSNTAIGYRACKDNTTGSGNVAIGHDALGSLGSGSGNILIGGYTGSSYSPVYNPTGSDNNRFVCGHTNISNSYVKVDWTVTSDARDKMNFTPVPYGLDFVNQLKPTSYQFKVDRDTETPNGPVRFGFKAQDILALEGENPVIIDNEDVDNLKYKGQYLVPVLVNAVQELSVMVKELQAEIQTLKG